MRPSPPVIAQRPAPSGHPARGHCLAPARTIDAPIEYSGRYGRLFPDLPALEADNASLMKLGDIGGACDGESATADASGPAGWPFFGQFVAHDITADRSALTSHANPAAVRNFRTPAANLECLYGAGPVGSPYLYQREDPAKLLVGFNDHGEPADLPRNAEGIALIGDPRNDVHVFVSQLHVALLKVHNAFVDRARQSGTRDEEVFDEASRATSWHYQWIMLNEYLPAAAGEEVVSDIMSSGPRFFRPEREVYLPFEFADGAFRYGHGQIRATYTINERSRGVAIFPDLIGMRPVPAERRVDWTLLFDTPDSAPAQRARRIDGKLVGSLIRLPHEITGELSVDSYRSLAARDLERGEALGLPSGESVALAMGEEPLRREETGLSPDDWSAETPLWLYFMLEGAARADGDRLGPAGGRILAEVLIGIVKADPGSYLAVEPDWCPTLHRQDVSEFSIADLLAFAAAA
jgi:Animal haem peroxidase